MYKLEKFSTSLFEGTKKEWIKQTGNLGEIGLLLAVDANRIFSYIEKDREEIDNFHPHFLVEDGAVHGCAILKILHAHPKSSDGWLKLLDINLEPDLNLEDRSDVTQKAAFKTIKAVAYAIGLSVSLIIDEDNTFGAGKLKIYGRTRVMRTLFTALLTDEDLSRSITAQSLTLSQEGSWLVIRKPS